AQGLPGTTNEKQKEYVKTKARFEDALKRGPKSATAANTLAWILSEQRGNIDVALNYAQAAREQQPEEPNIADTLGWIYYKKNAYLRAATLLKEAAEKLP